MKYEKLSKNPKQFPAMTGYTSEEFDSLLPHFEIRFVDEPKRKTLTGNRRTGRGYGEYKSSPLSGSRDNLLFIPVYLKQGMTQENPASLFGMHQPDANRRIHFPHPLLKGAPRDSGELPVRDAELLDFENEKLNVFLHDGTGRPVVRPKDNHKQRLYFSGEKRRHSLKNILISDVLRRVVFPSLTCEGKKHDKKAADEAGCGDRFPERSVLLQDTGFQGFSAESVRIIQPKKKPRGGKPTEEEKESNRRISGIRIRIEHVISGVKRYRTVKDKIRNRKKGFRDTVMETCCGLHNFRLRFRPWTPVTVNESL